MCEEYLALAGMALIIIAWIPETLQNVKERGKNLSPKFVLLYLFGSAFLAYHALNLHDNIFLALNSLATLIAMLNGVIIVANWRNNHPEKAMKAKKR